MFKNIKIDAVERKNTDIVFTKSFKKYLSTYIKRKNPNKLICITDKHLANRLNLIKIFPKSSIFTLPCGENYKNINSLQKILKFFYEKNINRKSLVVVIGGGVVTDLAGLASSIYYRGIPLVYIPTTLLSQVDASIGGKNAINYKNKKNIIGTVYLPKLIVIDTSVLRSLSQRQLYSGMAEVIKYAVGFDKKLIQILEKMDNFFDDIDYLIYRSVAIKINLVKRDLYEKGKKRKLLNLGHTLGQALESERHYFLSHGEAVAIGLVFSLFISRERKKITSSEFKRVLSLLKKYNLPPIIRFDYKKILEKMRYDKKSYPDSIDFILLKKLGKSFICNLSFSDIESYLKEFQTFYYKL